MTQFADLISPSYLVKGESNRKEFSAPAIQQREAADRFPQLVTRRGMCLWSDSERSKYEVRIVIGVSTASQYDMTLLDELRPYIPFFKASGIRIEVFNAYHFETLEEYEQRVPGIGKVFHTPVIGIWEKGVLTEKASGAAGRDVLQRFLSASTQKMTER